MPRGVYRHRNLTDEQIEKLRRAYYRWSGKKDPGNILEKPERAYPEKEKLQSLENLQKTKPAPLKEPVKE